MRAPCLGCALQGKDCHLALLMTISILHKLKRPTRMARQALPPQAWRAKTAEGEISTGEDEVWREACGGRWAEPLRIFSVFRPVWISLGFLISPERAAMAGTANVSSHQYR